VPIYMPVKYPQF